MADTPEFPRATRPTGAAQASPAERLFLSIESTLGNTSAAPSAPRQERKTAGATVNPEALFARMGAALSDGAHSAPADDPMRTELNRLWLRLDEIQAVAACLESAGLTDDAANAYACDADATLSNAKTACTDALARVLGVLSREAKRAHARIEKRSDF